MAGEQDNGTMDQAVDHRLNQINPFQVDDWPQRSDIPGGKGNPPVNSGTALGSKNDPPTTQDIPDTNLLGSVPEGGLRAEGT